MSNDNIFLSHKSLCVTFNIVLLASYFPSAPLPLHYGQFFWYFTKNFRGGQQVNESTEIYKRAQEQDN